MKVIYYICCIIGIFLYIGTAYSSILPSLDTDSLIYTKTKPNHAKPKTFSNNSFLSLPSSLNDNTKQTKLASVTFISKGSLGYEMSESSNGNCTADNYPYTSEMGLANCAVIEKCRDKNIIRARCASCKGNMALRDHKCSCDQAVYRYSVYENPCVYAYDQTNYCQEIGPDNVLRTFYADCTCPTDWKECSKEGEVGFGGACTAKGKAYYFGCTCEDPYILTCTGTNGDEHYDQGPSGRYCESVLTHTRYYKTCTEVCWDGYYKSAQDFWSRCGKNQCAYDHEATPENIISCKNAVSGDIYYTDGTCSHSIVSAKTSVGIIGTISCNGNTCTIGLISGDGAIGKNGGSYWGDWQNNPEVTFAEASSAASKYAPAACATHSSTCPGKGHWRLPTWQEVQSWDGRTIVQRWLSCDGVCENSTDENCWDNCDAESYYSWYGGQGNAFSIMAVSLYYSLDSTIRQAFWEYTGQPDRNAYSSSEYIIGDMLDDAWIAELEAEYGDPVNGFLWYYADFMFWTSTTVNSNADQWISEGIGQAFYFDDDWGYDDWSTCTNNMYNQYHDNNHHGSCFSNGYYHNIDYGVYGFDFPKWMKLPVLPYTVITVTAN